MTESARSAANINWQRRYQDLREQQDKQQARYKRKQALLVKALAQLSQFSRELDPAADEKLLALRGLLRQKQFSNVDLAQVVDSLEKQLETSLKARSKQQKNAAEQLTGLLKQTSTLAESAEVQNRLNELKATIESQPVQYSTLAAHLASLSQLHAIAVKDRRSGQSLLQRWFGPATPDKQTDDLPLSLETIAGYLKRLLEEIEHGEEMQGTFEVARDVLDEGLSLDNMELAVQSVAEVVLASVASDRSEMTEYLSDMNARLKTATKNLGESQQLLIEEIALQQEFGENMQNSVQGMRSQVKAGEDLQQLKQDINHSLDNMVAVVSANQQRGSVIHSQLSDQLSSLVERAKALEEQGAMAEQRAAEQRHRALTDSLTKLPNRESYEETAAREVQRWQRYERPLSLAVCDVDLFKSVNDSYGHDAGDEVLKQIAELLQQRLRGSDFLARYGGEEFVVLLPETDQQEAALVMESVRELIQLSSIHYGKKRIDVTISIGIAEFRGKDILQSAFTRADRALYQAKLAGRNRVNVAND